MKTAAILSFTDAGEALAEKVAAAVAADYVSETLRPRGGLMPAAAELFRSRDALIFIGACGLTIACVLPILVTGLLSMNRLSFTGTSMIIVVGVVLETLKAVESMMMVRNYKGFLNN